MTNINLLPEDLREKDKSGQNWGRDEIRYSHPVTEEGVKSPSKPSADRFLFWGQFWHKIKSSFSQKGKKDLPLKSSTVNSKLNLITPTATVVPSPKPVATPVSKIPNGVANHKNIPLPAQSPNNLIKPVKVGWYEKLFLSKPKVSIKPLSVVANNHRPVAPVHLEEKKNNGLTKMHMPQNVSSQPGLEVDLVADKSLFFSWEDFFHRLKIGSIILGVVILVLVATYFVVLHFEASISQEDDLKEEIQIIESQLADFEKERQEIVILDKRLVKINQLLDNHLFLTRLFALLEKNTLTDVYYSNFSFDTSGRVILSATAKDYSTLAQQLVVWQKQKEIKAVDFTQASLVEHSKTKDELEKIKKEEKEAKIIKVVNFDLFLDLKPAFLSGPNYETQ
jgi:hypothetical protein